MNTDQNNTQTAAATEATAASNNTAAATEAPAASTTTTNRWDRLAQLVTDGTFVDVTVNKVATNKEGKQVGLHVTIEGTRAFLPGSEFPRNQRPNENMVGTTVRVKVLEVDAKVKGGRVVVSRKAVFAAEQHAFIESLSEGQEVTGVVARKTDFGYFVNLGIVDGLLHISQVPGRNGEKTPIEIGQELSVRVRKTNADKGEVGLTLFTETQNDRPARNNNQGPSQRRQVEKVTRATAAFKTQPAKTPKAPTPPSAPKTHRAPTKKNPFTKTFTSFADLAASMAGDSNGTTEVTEATTPVGESTPSV